MREKRIGVFLDRDGTINNEVGYVRTPEELQLVPGADGAIRKLNERHLVTCIISNQSGIARGFLTEQDLIPIHAKLEKELARSHAGVDRIYYCPHHPTEGKAPYNIVCDCRKPKTGMLERGVKEFALDRNRLFVVGDSVVDMQAGNAMGARKVLVLTGYGKKAQEQCIADDIPLDFVAPSIVEAVEFVVEKVDGEFEKHEQHEQ